jgi:hypothetical protein
MHIWIIKEKWKKKKKRSSLGRKEIIPERNVDFKEHMKTNEDHQKLFG